MEYRIMVKMPGMTRYQAIMQDSEGFTLAPANKIYHSYFAHADAVRLCGRLEENGIKAKIIKG